MQDIVHIDSHKLMYHPERVSDWLKGNVIYPIEMEVGLSGRCNHRCVFCALDYVEYKSRFIDADILLSNLFDLYNRGLKSIIYSGEGEPLLNKNASYIFNKSKDMGIDIALSTNGVLLDKSLSKECLHSLSWIRFSIAGAKDSTYESIHRAPKGDLQRVLKNLDDAVKVKKESGLQTTLGVQLLLIPENICEVAELAKIVKKIGANYLTIKPYSQHPKSKNKNDISYLNIDELKQDLYQFASENFKIFFRDNATNNISQEKSYNICRGLPFMVHMDAGGNVFPCCAFIGDDNFKYGNIYEQKFIDFWESKRKVEIQSRFQGEFLKQKCRKACRLDEINKYLDALMHKNAHINFI